MAKFREIEEPDIPITVKQLIVGTRLPCDIFIRENDKLKILFNKDVLYTKISQDILKEKGISEVYIFMRDTHRFDYYLSANRSLNQPRDVDVRAAFKEYAYRKEQYHQIDPTLLTPGTQINFSLLLLNKFDFSPLVDASDNSPAKVDETMLKVAGDIIIKKSDLPRYYEYIRALRQSAGLSATDNIRIKSLAVKETSKIVLQDFLADPRSGEKIKEVNTLVNDMIDCILEDRDAIYMLLSMKGHDYYTYTHSVNVAALAVSLSVAIDMKRDDTEKLGTGAMLHDVGKSVISHEILNKQGKLNNVEYRVMKTHVIEGEKIMRTHKNFPEEAFGPVLQHHEKLSCKGYPYGLCGKDIGLFGRISSIADCYDALTTTRPYKRAFSPFAALSVISKETGDYDADLLKIFIKMLGKIM
jgi:putative nucleotidyltransferase with HDIG domain